MKQKNWLARKVKGTYTVEAALVMSLIVFILAALLYLAFVLHDCAVLKGYLCETAACAAHVGTEKEEEAGRTCLNRMTSKRFLGSRAISSSLQAGEDTITVSGSASYSLPGVVSPFFGGKTSLSFSRGYSKRGQILRNGSGK